LIYIELNLIPKLEVIPQKLFQVV